MDIWREISNSNGKYFINYNGVVKNNKGKIMKTYETEKGYLKISLILNGKKHNCFIHRLVAEAFIPNPENKPQVDHINRRVNCNTVSNLRWVTPSENALNKFYNVSKQQERMTT